MTPPLFLVATDALAADVVLVDGVEGRHAADVRRLRAGEAVLLGDGQGLVAAGTVVEVGRGRISVRVAERRQETRPRPSFVVAQALAKGGRDVDAVEAMTEVGVDEILAWTAARSVARWSDRAGERWRVAAREAAKQSRRAWVPAVSGPLGTAGLCDRGRAAALAVVRHESAARPVAGRDLPADGEIVVVVGPEGGIDGDELDQLAGAGAAACRLGDGVLRTSTAGVAALSVLSAATRWR